MAEDNKPVSADDLLEQLRIKVEGSRPGGVELWLDSEEWARFPSKNFLDFFKEVLDSGR